MKLFKNMMSRKPEHEETVGKIDLDMDVEPLRRRSDILADDSGEPNRAARSKPQDPLFADPAKPSGSRGEEPEEVAGAGWGANAWGGDDWDDDDDWGDEELDDLDDGEAAHADPAPGNRWADDGEFGRKAIARSQLAPSGDAEDRILEKTNSKMVDRESSRRHSAMAHLKKAAAATKADRVLKDVATRDPAGDPTEQSPYRDDLAKVVRPRTTSRPTSRSHSRPQSMTPSWDAAEVDEEALRSATGADESGADFDFGADDTGFDDPASRFADDPTERFTSNEDRFAAEGSAFAQAEESVANSDATPAEERPSLVPDDLSEDDFADEDDRFSAFTEDRFADAGGAPAEPDAEEDDDFEAPNFADVNATGTASHAFGDMPEDEADGPVPSRVVSEAIAFANAPEETESIDPDEVRRKIWDLAEDAPVVRDPAETRRVVTEAPAPAEPAQPSEPVVDLASVAPTVTGRAGRSAGRVKTRLLGFQDPDDVSSDVFEEAKSATPAAEAKYPVGWIIVVEGPGHGSCFTLFNGVSQIGRGEDQAVRLDFGDTSISRNNHAAVAFDDEQAKFFLGHGGKSNLVRLNGKPVLSTEELSHGDTIRIGETSLKFIALCGDDFNWTNRDGEDAENGDNA